MRMLRATDCPHFAIEFGEAWEKVVSAAGVAGVGRSLRFLPSWNSFALRYFFRSAMVGVRLGFRACKVILFWYFFGPMLVFMLNLSARCDAACVSEFRHDCLVWDVY